MVVIEIFNLFNMIANNFFSFEIPGIGITFGSFAIIGLVFTTISILIKNMTKGGE